MPNSMEDRSPGPKRNWLIPVKSADISWGQWLLRRILVIFGLVALVCVVGGLTFKNDLIFHGRPDIDSTPRNYGQEYREVWLRTADGLQVKAWILPDETDDRRAAALFFQGNAGNMSYMLPQLSALRALGLTVMAVDYPGYGESQGRPDEANVYQTAEALWQYAVAQGFAPENIIIYGFSLGGGVASHLAWSHPPAALVLDSTFTRLRDVPSDHMPWLKPYFKLLLGDMFDTKRRLADMHCPLLIIHRPGDTVVPYRLGQELFESYGGGYKDIVAGDGDHMDFIQNQGAYLDRLERLLDVALSRSEGEVQAAP